MAKTTKRKQGAPPRRTPANDSSRWYHQELKRKLRREREIGRLVRQLENARVRSSDMLRQFAVDYLSARGFVVSRREEPADAAEKTA